MQDVCPIFELTWCPETVQHILNIVGFPVPEDGVEDDPHEIDPRQLQQKSSLMTLSNDSV